MLRLKLYPPLTPSGEHRYSFRIFGLDNKLDLLTAATKEELHATMKGHVLASAELTGVYQKHEHAVAG